MKTRFNLISYHEKNIVLLDYSKVIYENELAMLVNQGLRYAIEGEKKNRNLLVLVDLTGSKVDGKGLEELKRTYQELKPYVRRKAIVRADYKGLRLINLLNFIKQSPTRIFVKNEDALSYLVA